MATRKRRSRLHRDFRLAQPRRSSDRPKATHRARSRLEPARASSKKHEKTPAQPDRRPHRRSGVTPVANGGAATAPDCEFELDGLMGPLSGVQMGGGRSTRQRVVDSSRRDESTVSMESKLGNKVAGMSSPPGRTAIGGFAEPSRAGQQGWDPQLSGGQSSTCHIC